MGLFSAIFDLIAKIVSKIVSVVKTLFKKLWPLLLIVAAVYFAPAIGTWLGANGAPSFLVEAFTWVGANVTPLLTSGLQSLWAGTTGLASSAWSSFKGAKLMTQLAIVTGASALIAPEETAEVLTEAGTLVGTAVGAVTAGVAGGIVGGLTGALVSGATSNPWLVGIAALGVGYLTYSWLKEDENSEETVVISSSSDHPYEHRHQPAPAGMAELDRLEASINQNKELAV